MIPIRRFKQLVDRLVRRELSFPRLCFILAITICALSPNAYAEDSLFTPGSSPSAQTAQAPIQPNAAASAPNSDRQVRQATHLEIEPSRITSGETLKSLPLPAAEHGDSQRSSGGSALSAIFSVLFSLAIVLGLFMLIAWLARRGLPKTSARLLPLDAVDVLGRAPLAGRQQMHLIRLGNKLLLVCVSQNGVNTLGEVADPAEVERLVACCTRGSSQTKTAGQAFSQFFSQVTRKSLANSPTGGEVQNA